MRTYFSDLFMLFAIQDFRSKKYAEARTWIKRFNDSKEQSFRAQRALRALYRATERAYTQAKQL